MTISALTNFCDLLLLAVLVGSIQRSLPEHAIKSHGGWQFSIRVIAHNEKCRTRAARIANGYRQVSVMFKLDIPVTHDRMFSRYRLLAENTVFQALAECVDPVHAS